MNNTTALLIIIGVPLIKILSENIGVLWEEKDTIKHIFEKMVNVIKTFKEQHTYIYTIMTIFFFLSIICAIILQSSIPLLFFCFIFLILSYPKIIFIFREVILSLLWFLYYFQNIVWVFVSSIFLIFELALLSLFSIYIAYIAEERVFALDLAKSISLSHLLIMMLFSFGIMLIISLLANSIENYYFYREWRYQIRKFLLTFIVTIIFTTFFGIDDIISRYLKEFLDSIQAASSIEKYFNLSISEIITFFSYWIFGLVLCFQLTNNISKELIHKGKSTDTITSDSNNS